MSRHSKRISQEKVTVRRMVTLFCNNRHHPSGSDGLCDDCRELLQYACQRLTHCPKGNDKGSCRICEIHCYSPARREAIRRVMRYAGPRMILYHPLTAMRHLWAEWTH